MQLYTLDRQFLTQSDIITHVYSAVDLYILGTDKRLILT